MDRTIDRDELDGKIEKVREFPGSADAVALIELIRDLPDTEVARMSGKMKDFRRWASRKETTSLPLLWPPLAATCYGVDKVLANAINGPAMMSVVSHRANERYTIKWVVREGVYALLMRGLAPDDVYRKCAVRLEHLLGRPLHPDDAPLSQEQIIQIAKAPAPTLPNS